MSFALPHIAILSFLFNWPTRGGGNIHSVELGKFLRRAGCDTRLFYPVFAPWEIGRVSEALPCPSSGLRFSNNQWSPENVRERFSQAIDDFNADAVIIMDAWNFKPWLAEAAGDRPFFLRFQAQELLCPLNNLRLLPKGPNILSNCPSDQLRSRNRCLECVAANERFSGQLHRAEREFSRVGTPEYESKLRWSLEAAEASFVLNREAAELIRPFTNRVEIIPWGMDESRFPQPLPKQTRHSNITKIFMAGSADDPIKGFQVLHDACRTLRKERQDFMLIVTGDPQGQADEFTHFVGWQSQDKLPAWYRDTDICVVPTIVPDGLSRTSVEAMACGRPVIASRIGGLPDTIDDGRNGFLFRPGDSIDLADKLRLLLDDADLRHEMGIAGRRRFERDFRWDIVIDRHYRKLFNQLEPVVCTA